ncbi:hypothetical protein FB451DRAFT_519336 [Mycena latifolia]|nr:hypothetical protein FB451DRAFT_519336 [Mycena latifolia]
MQSNDVQSTFQRAFDIYIQGLPKKQRKRTFIDTAYHADATPESIHESVKQAEQKYSDQIGTRMVKRIVGPVVDVLKDYVEIISTLVSANPMPTAVIWGGLKILIDGLDRFLRLFEIIKNELRSLTGHLQRINDYQNLYGNSDRLQEMLCTSYINMLRFWSRVDKECDTCGCTRFLKAATSFSTNKLNKIIKDIKDDADQIEKLASILEATKSKEARQAAELEWFHAGLERAAAQKERSAQAASRQETESDRQEERYRRISEWLCARQGNEENMRLLRKHTGLHLNGTCDWLFQHTTYLDWRDGRFPSPILWLHAPPAAGKSILSSRVIQVLKKEQVNVATVIYHFYRFDQTTSASETLRLIASQLFDAHWNRAHIISKEMHLMTQQSVCSLENVEELIKMLVKLLPKSYFILDGLDEECMNSSNRWTEAATVLDFLIDLAKDVPDRVRLWYSSQYLPSIKEKLKEYVVLDIKEAVKGDVSMYLSRANPKLELEVPDLVLRSLRSRADGNFLWARLMLESLNETDSLTDMKQFVAGVGPEGLPETLDDYYRRIFNRFEKPHRRLVSKVFALVAFARRPLKMKELREAVGLLQSKNPRSLVRADMPPTPRLCKLLPPLIEMQEEGCTDPDDFICRLFHSTIRDFLFKNPGVLQTASDPAVDLLINQDVIANACLLYLSQARYARQLKKHNARWIDAAGDSVDRHQFHLYAAKYWDKHLDEVIPTEALENRVGSFIMSSNFQTCIQVQSLWVDAQFGVFSYVGDNRNHTYLRRMFPAWFVAGSPTGMKLWHDFRGFLHEWKYFLHCPKFEEPDCITLPYTGQLDRCWWPALSRNNFLSKLKCRYTTFRLQKEESLDPGNGGQCFEGVGAEGKEVMVLRLTSRENGTLEFTCERWRCIPGRLPTLQRTQRIITDEKTTNWLLYVKHSTETSDMRVGRAWPAAFSQSNQFLRIGARLFSRDDMGDYIPMPGFNSSQANYPSCVEEFAARGHFTALATRRRVLAAETYDTGLPDDKLDAFGDNFLKMEAVSHKSRREIGAESDSESSHYSDSSSELEDAGYETWSQCSTEHSDGFGDDIITPWAGPGSDVDDSDSDVYFSESESEVADDDMDEGQNSVEPDSDSASDIQPSAVIGYGVWHDDDDNRWRDDSDSDSDGGFYGPPPLATLQKWNPGPQTGLEASIMIFDSRSNADKPTKIFHFARSLPFLLYDSPPALHPSKNLVVWPLSAGDVLFADFLRKTYFVRKLRPSTSYTRHIFMKCHFSPCGLYIHFASLEAQKKPISGHKKKTDPGAEMPPVKLALLVSTYRLSSRKTSRSPPTLVHRVRLDLGSKTAISVTNLPFTLTWMPTELYFTCSDYVLTVFRIPLFSASKGSAGKECPVLVPRKPIFLPQTAESRPVYYFPPDDDDDDDRAICRVIIGSETRARVTNAISVDDQFFGSRKDSISAAHVFGLLGGLSPPVGCYLNEQVDLGGWGKSFACSHLPTDLGIGQLDRRLEKFDPEDDCDLEPYIF